MQKVKWGIIGCGEVTEIKSGPAFNKAEGSELIAVMRRNGDLAKDYALRHGVKKWYDKADQLINDPEVNAVYIATPPSTHKEYTLAAARAGKAVYVEKPMAMTYGACKEMIKVCKLKNVPLFVAYYRRALPRFLKIKTFLENNTIGNIRTVNVRLYKPISVKDLDKDNWRVDPAIAGGGYFFDLASHIIDLLQFFLGPIKSAHGFKSNRAHLYKAEDTVSAGFLFENGVHGTGNWCFAADDHLDKTEIIGSEGKITYSNFEDNPIILHKNGYQEAFEIEHPKHIQQPLIQRIVDELLGKGISPSRGSTAIMTNFVMDQICK